ncbi:MAG: TSUP family transporter [Bacteroidia bacterium]|nr:TSUP family transporter [Bacteroidia bacterium]
MLLLFAAFGAGFIDAIIGGGGLIQLPALMFFFKGKALPLIFGTSKLAGFAGTSVAAVKYLSKTKVIFRAIFPAILFAIPCAYFGAMAVKGINEKTLKPIIIVLFSLVAIYTFFNKNFGVSKKAKEISGKKQIILSALTGLIIGFYDGFFGPGTGSFLVFIYVVLFGFEFLQASAHAKLVNAVTNIAALCLFISHGDVDFYVAIPVAIMNIGGSLLGTSLAIKKGSGFIRVFFIIVVTAFIIKMTVDLFTS